MSDAAYEVAALIPREPTTAYIPRQADVATRPMPAVDQGCHWCSVRLRAVPEPPMFWEAHWYHRTGCYPAARLRHNGYLPTDYVPIAQV